MRRLKRILVSYVLVAAMLPFGSVAFAQGDIVPVSDITGGSSVFIWPRGSAGAAPKKFITQRKSRRGKEERIEGAKRLTKQYETLAKVAPRRNREAVIDPTDPRLPKIPTMPKEEASKLFTGVGEFYIDKNDSENAMNFFREATHLDPKNPIAPKGLSEALALKGNEVLVKDQVKAAKDLFEEALKYNPNNAVAFYGLAEVYSEQELDSQSIENYEKALKFDKALTEIYVPLGILYYQAGNIAKADELLTKAVAADANSAETQYFLGLVRYAQNNNSVALNAFETAVRLKPDYAEAFYYKGETLDRVGKSAEAAAAYQKALDLKPDYLEAAMDLGSEYYKMKQWNDSIVAYKKAVKLKNDNVLAYINLGDAYRNYGDANGPADSYENAEANYNLAVSFFERQPDFNKNDKADTYNKIGYVIAQQCPINVRKFLPCRWNVATSSLEKAVALTNDNVDYSNLGWAYYNAAKKDAADRKDADAKLKLEKARTNLQRAAAADSRYLNAPLVNLGMALNDLGDYKTAIDVLTRVTDREPKWVFAVDQLGIAYLGNKDYSKAIDRFNVVVKRDDKYAMGWFNLGKAQFANGNVGEAKKAYSQLRKLKANNLADKLDRETGGAMARG